MPDNDTRDDAEWLEAIRRAVDNLCIGNFRKQTVRFLLNTLDARDAALREARKQGAVSAYRQMRLWHEGRYKEARTLSETNGLAGAHMTAHRDAAEYCQSFETAQPEHTAECHATLETARPAPCCARVQSSRYL